MYCSFGAEKCSGYGLGFLLPAERYKGPQPTCNNPWARCPNPRNCFLMTGFWYHRKLLFGGSFWNKASNIISPFVFQRRVTTTVTLRPLSVSCWATATTACFSAPTAPWNSGASPPSSGATSAGPWWGNPNFSSFRYGNVVSSIPLSWGPVYAVGRTYIVMDFM